MEGKASDEKEPISTGIIKRTLGNNAVMEGGNSEECGKVVSGSDKDIAASQRFTICYMPLNNNENGFTNSLEASDGNANQEDGQDIKREKRKQLNREAARRSRLKKLEECQELQAKVDLLRNETRMLTEELQRLAEECEKVSSENNAIEEELAHLRGKGTTSSLRVNNHVSALFSV